MSETLPTLDEFLASNEKQAKSALPTMDELVARTPSYQPYDQMAGLMNMFPDVTKSVGHIMGAVGQGAAEGYGGAPRLGDELERVLSKAGIGADINGNYTSIMQAFNGGIIRPLATGLNAASGIAGAVAGAVPPLFGQTATELAKPIFGEQGAQQFGRAIAGMAEATMADLGSRIPPHPVVEANRATLPANSHPLFEENLARWQGQFGVESAFREGRANGVLGPDGEDGWKFGTNSELPANDDWQRPFEAAKATDQPPPEAPVSEPAPDVHTIARQIAPDTFQEYDGLSARVDELRGQIADAQAELRRGAEAQAPGAAEIADLEDRLQDTTPRLAKKYQARLDELRPAHDEFMAGDHMAVLTRDTEEIAALRQQLQAADYRMRDLAPDVTAAYREAVSRVPAVEEAPPAAPVEAPVAAPDPAAAPVAAAPPAVTPAAAPEAPKPVPVSIAADVSRKLLAAGRPAEEANAAAALVQAHYEARAARFGGAKGTAEEMYARDGADIRAGRERARTPEYAQRGKEYQQPAYHGSPHIFDKFTLDHIGSGEGAQAYGHGLYFAGNKAVAKFYREELSSPTLTIDGHDIFDKKSANVGLSENDRDALGRIALWMTDRERGSFKDVDALVAALRKAGQEGRADLLERYKDRLGVQGEGRLYHVDIPEDHEYLDWDKPLSEQPAKIQEAVAPFLKERRENLIRSASKWGNPSPAELANYGRQADEIIQKMTGEKIYKEITDQNGLRREGADAKASKALNEAGIPGIRYLDNGSRRVGEGTHNYVLFDADLANIKEYEQQARGKIRLDDGRALITLFKSANASTFLHETGHAWLAELLDDAKDAAAPADLTRDAETVRSWLGAANDAEITTKQHEKFARGFERYMMEGRAPSSALADVFAKFKSWLTQIYETVTRLKAPITDDIRDVFDRLLVANPDARAAIVPERAMDVSRETGGQLPVAPPPEKPSPLFPKRPKEPTRLVSFIRKAGGIRDVGGDVDAIMGGPKSRPGLINNATGIDLDDMTHMAWEAGYFPDHQVRPTINELIDAIGDDLKDTPRYSEHDVEKVADYHDAIARNNEIAKLANDHDIDTTGMTRQDFYAALSEKLSLIEQEERIRSQTEAHEAEFSEATAEAKEWLEGEGHPWDSDAFYGLEGPRTETELEAEHGQADAARPVEQGADRGAEPTASGRSAGDVQEGGGSRGRGAGDAGRDEGKGGTTGRGGSTEGEPEPKLDPIGGGVEARDFRTKDDRDIEKAANIRLDKINGTDDLNAALKEIAAQNDDFMNARYGEAAYRNALDIRSTRTLLRLATSEAMEAAAEAAKGDPAAIADWATKNQRAALVFQKLSSLTADWAHAGHELNKVMPGWDATKDIAKQIQDTTGKTLFQMQEQAAAMAGMQTAEQAGKFASDMTLTWRDKAKAWTISYFINNLISGPLTHGAYMVGNEFMAIMKATGTSALQATSGAIREAIAGEPIDRVYFGEIAPQFLGMMRGAKYGLPAGLEAFKTGVPFMKGLEAQGALDIGTGARPQVIPGKIGYVLETPGRAVTMIHTVFYSMGYEQELSRLAARDAISKGLEGTDRDTFIANAVQSPSAEMMDAAHNEALKMVLMERPVYGSAQSKWVSAVNSTFLAKLAIPFMQIGTNILKQGLVDHTPLALLTQAARDDLAGVNGGAARDLRVGKISVGTMVAAGTVGLAVEGLITGGGPPTNSAEGLAKRRVMEDSGWHPYSVKFGDTYIPFRKFLGPLGALVAAAADIHEVAHEGEEHGLTHAVAALAFGFGEVVADESWLSGLSSLIDAARHWDTKGEQYLRNLSTSFLPFSSLMSQTARLVDPYQRVARNEIDAIRNKIPFASEGLEPQIGIWGQPIASHTMLTPTTDRHDPVDERLKALDMGVAMPGRTVRGVKLTDAEYTDLATTGGKLARMQLEAIVGTRGFAALPQTFQTDAIKKVISGAHEAARSMLLVKYPHIIMDANEARRKQMMLGMAPAGE